MLGDNSVNHINTQFVKNVYNTKNMVKYYTELVINMGLFKSEKMLYEKYLKINDKILDIGCGAGRTTIALYKQGYKNIIGLDISDEMIGSAKLLNENINFIVGDATKLQYDSESFDKVIFSFNGLMLIPKLESRLRALKEIHRVLKSEGYFIFSTPYLDNKINNKFWSNESIKWNERNFDSRLHEFGDILVDDLGVDEIFIHIPLISEIEECLRKTGFELIKCLSRIDICLEDESVEEQLDDNLFWVVKKKNNY